MTPDSGDVTLPELGRMVKRLDTQLDSLQGKFEGHQSHFDDRFDRLQAEVRASFASLQFVSKEAYQTDRAANERRFAQIEQRMGEVEVNSRERSDYASRVAWWAMGLLGGAVTLLGVIMAILKTVGG